MLAPASATYAQVSPRTSPNQTTASSRMPADTRVPLSQSQSAVPRPTTLRWKTPGSLS
jgi:hypothetical protein